MMKPTLISALLLAGLFQTNQAEGAANDDNAIPEPSPNRINYAKPQDYLLLQESLGDKERIQTLAATLKASTPERTLVAIGRWIEANLKYDDKAAYAWRNFDTALDTKVCGSCADHAVVFAALARACGIPAVFLKSMDTDWIREFRTTGSCSSWRGHVFLEVFIEGRWRLLDAQAMSLYDDYEPAMRILPGNRYAYDKGSDPRELVLSLDWEQWKKQTAAYFSKFDLTQLPVGGGRPLGALYVAANSPIYEALTRRLQALGHANVYSFNTQFEKNLRQAKGGDLIITCVGDAVVLPGAHRAQFLPVSVGDLIKKMETEPKGVLRKQLDDGTKVVLIYGKDMEAIQEAIASFQLEPENKDPITPEMRESLAKIHKVHAGMKKEVIDAALDEFYKDLQRLEPKIFLPLAIGDLMRLAPKYLRTQKVLRDGLANGWLEPNRAHAMLVTAGDDPALHINALIENMGASDAKTRRAALNALRICAPNAQQALPILRKIIDDAKAPASDYQRAFTSKDEMPEHVLAYVAKNLIEAGRLDPDEIKEFVADPSGPFLSGDFKQFKITRKDLEIILRDGYIEEEENWKHGYSHVGGGERTGHVILKDGKKVDWMVKPGGLAWLKFESGKKLYILTDWVPFRMVLVQIIHDKDKEICVTIHSDETTEQKSAVSVDDGIKAIGQIQGWGSRVGAYVTFDQSIPRAELKKLLVAVCDNPLLALEYFGRDAPKAVVDHFVKAPIDPKLEPWTGEPAAVVKWVSGGKLSTFKRLPKADDVTALRITGEYNRTTIRLTAATFPGVLGSMRPVKADDPKYKEWSYADWHVAEFETSAGRFRVNFYLGGLALLCAPDDSVGLVTFDFPK